MRAALTALLLCSLPAAAETVRLEGDFVQGGLVVGRTEPGAKVAVDGRAVVVRPDGRFLLGFGRDAAAKALLVATLPDGGRQELPLAIAKRTYDVQRIDGLPPESVSPGPADLERIEAEQNLIAAARFIDSPVAYFDGGFVWPAVGPVSGVYGSQRILNGQPRQPHYGVDIAAPEGAPVTAPSPGIVRLAEADLYFTGGTVILDHGYGLSSTFSHLSAVLVAVGDRLAQGQLVGRVGKTGRATGAHLDWRLNLFDVRLDPALLVGPMPAAEASAQ